MSQTPKVLIHRSSTLHSLQSENNIASSLGDFHLSDVYAFSAGQPADRQSADRQSADRQSVDRPDSASDGNPVPAHPHISHHVFSREEFSERLAKRRRRAEESEEEGEEHPILRLADPSVCCSVETERETVITAATLNWAIYPLEYRQGYDLEREKIRWYPWVYGKNMGLSETGAGNKIHKTGSERAIAQDEWFLNQTQELASYLGIDIGADMGKVGNLKGGGKISSNVYPTGHFNEGSSDTAGVALAVYDNSNGTRVFVFRGSYSDGDMNNILNLYGDWFLERFQQQIIRMWERTGHMMDSDMRSRKDDGIIEECLMRHFGPGMGNNVAKRLGRLVESDPMFAETVSETDLEHYGYWPIIKQIVRHVLPADRDRTKEGLVVFSGHSQGGFNANMVSMWLEKEDQAIYRSLAFSGTGTQCAARQLSTGDYTTDGYDYLDDVDPFLYHPQLTTFCHPLDGYCNIDYANGRVCSYGDSLLGTGLSGGSGLESIFSNIVGFSGPLLTIDKIRSGPKQWFEESRYWTHSMTFFLALAVRGTDFLDNQAITDGGCWNQTIVEISDPNHQCPDGHTSNWKCPFIIFSTIFISGAAVVGTSCAATLFCYLRNRRRNILEREKRARLSVIRRTLGDDEL